MGRRLGLVGLVGVLLFPGGAAAQEAATLTVAQDGSGDHATIGEAIVAAASGDTILIAPGTYVEYLEIDKDLTISGQGDRADVVIEPPEEQEERHIIDGFTSLVLIWSDGVYFTLQHVTIGPRLGFAIAVNGGTAHISDILVPDTILTLEGATVAIEGSDLHLLEFGDESEVRVTDSILRNSAILWGGATAVFEDNEVLDRPIVADDGASITVTGNSFRPADDEVGVAVVDPEAVGHISDNSFTGGEIAIVIEYPTESTVEGNTIEGAATGIVAVQSGVAIRDNTVTDAGDLGIETVGEGMTIERNLIDGGRVGLSAMPLPDDAHPRATEFGSGPFVRGNSITGASHFGVLVDEVSIELSDNVICAEREPLRIEGEANLVLGANDICESGAG